MKEISLKDLLEAGCHFGHQTTRWNPKMKQYIFTARDRIHIFDLVQTKKGLEDAMNFVKETAAAGGKIIFVGTKRQAQDIVREAAEKTGMPFITERWIGGLITNWDEVKKRIAKLSDLKAGKAEGRFKDRTKKENLLIDRQIARLERIFGGVSGLTDLPAAIFVTDARKDDGAIKEAASRGVKVIAIVDTNASPENVDFVIPANDDATKCLQLIVGAIVEAIEEGKKSKTPVLAETSKTETQTAKLEKTSVEEPKEAVLSKEEKTKKKTVKRTKKEEK